MNPIEYWKLSRSYSIVQATLLFCGEDPSELEWRVEENPSAQPPGYTAVKTALVNAVASGRLDANVTYDAGGFGNEASVSIHGTTIDRHDLNEFFDGANVPGQFFGRWATPTNQANPSAQLPPKLNAALRAWTAVTSDPALLRGKSPKQALEAWLLDHAVELGLTNRMGQPNKTGIDEICKVANWKPEGGATPTPGPLPPQITDSGPTESFYDLDDEIPF